MRLTHNDPQEALTLRADILPVYSASHADLMHNHWFLPDNFWDRLVENYAKTQDFDLVAAWEGEQMVGYAFGSPRESIDLWEDICAIFPDPRPYGPVYIFREFAVLPNRQRQGYGRAIHDELLKTRSEQAAHLLVRPDNVAAQAAYRSWGWVKVGTHRPFPDSPTFDALALDLTTFK